MFTNRANNVFMSGKIANYPKTTVSTNYGKINGIMRPTRNIDNL